MCTWRGARPTTDRWFRRDARPHKAEEDLSALHGVQPTLGGGDAEVTHLVSGGAKGHRHAADGVLQTFVHRRGLPRIQQHDRSQQRRSRCCGICSSLAPPLNRRGHIIRTSVLVRNTCFFPCAKFVVSCVSRKMALASRDRPIRGFGALDTRVYTVNGACCSLLEPPPVARLTVGTADGVGLGFEAVVNDATDCSTGDTNTDGLRATSPATGSSWALVTANGA